jgi:hypothetical protein
MDAGSDRRQNKTATDEPEDGETPADTANFQSD